MKKALIMAIMTVLALAVVSVPASTVTEDDQLKAMLKSYTDSLARHSFTDHMSCFARQVQWFDKKLPKPQLENLLRTEVFNKYSTLDMNLSDVNVYISGNSAHSLCNKEWRFCSDKEGYCGGVRSKFGFIREGSDWKINSVQDIKVYWSSKKFNICCAP